MAVSASLGAFACGAPAAAESFEYTDNCADRLSSSDEALVELAYRVVYQYQDRMWDEIAADEARSAGPDKCYYSDVPDKHREKWTDAMEHVKVNCDSSKCAKSSGLYGLCGLASWDLYPSDKILVCVENIRSAASSLNSTISADAVAAGTFAKLAGTIAHEVMHQSDGLQGHPTGYTDYESPNTSAETVGVAMEHVLLSPDLYSRLSALAVAWDGSGYQVDGQIEVSNGNTFSGPVGTVPFSERVRNDTFTRLGIYLDGSWLGYQDVPPIDGGASVVFPVSFRVDAYAGGNGNHELKVVTDYLDNVWELSESNNETVKSFSLAPDLSVAVEIAGNYVSGAKKEVKAGFMQTTKYRRLTYNVAVSNRDADTTSPVSELTIQYEDIWNGGTLSTRIYSVPSLAPGGVSTTSFTVDVPETLTGTVSGVTDVYFAVDVRQAVPDYDRGNNLVHLAIDDAYFRPDYRVTLDGLAIDGLQATAAYTIKNVGPVAATQYSWAGLYLNGTLTSRALTGKLGVTQSVAGSLALTFTGLKNLSTDDVTFTFLLKADCSGAISENNEDNNSGSTTITVPGVTLKAHIEMENGWLQANTQIGTLRRYDYAAGELLFESVLNGIDWAGWYLANSGNGPFLPDVEYDVANQVLITNNRYAVSTPVVNIVWH